MPNLIVSCFDLFGCQLLEAFLKRKQRGSESGGEGRWGAGRNRERGNCGWDGLYEKGIYFQLKQQQQKETGLTM